MDKQNKTLLERIQHVMENINSYEHDTITLNTSTQDEPEKLRIYNFSIKYLRYKGEFFAIYDYPIIFSDNHVRIHKNRVKKLSNEDFNDIMNFILVQEEFTLPPEDFIIK